ncbi:MAG: hypothetical protein ACM32J_14760 [Rhizobacter sp.]|jgi:hypothetical protein
MQYSAVLLLLAAGAMPSIAQAQTSVGVSIGIQQPGVYGRIDIGNHPPPMVVYPEPVIVMPARVRHEPLYLYVPPGHQKKWDKHCGRYDACGRPVYFVREEWVRDRYEERHGRGDKHGRGNGNGNGRDRGDDGRHGHKHGDKHGRNKD